MKLYSTEAALLQQEKKELYLICNSIYQKARAQARTLSSSYNLSISLLASAGSKTSLQISNAFGPDNLTTAMAETPLGVDKAQIVSVCSGLVNLLVNI